LVRVRCASDSDRIASSQTNSCEVPKPDSCTEANASLFDHLEDPLSLPQIQDRWDDCVLPASVLDEIARHRQPPSISRTAPVMNRFIMRKRIAWATSLAVPTRPTGWACATRSKRACASVSEKRDRQSGVAV